MSAKLLLIAALASMPAAGCANRCDYALTRCQYQCDRNYRVCQLHGNEEFYCGNQVGNCTASCEEDRRTCHSWIYY